MTTVVFPFWAELLIAVLLVAGSILALIGCAGLLRLPDFHSRMHAPTLGNSMGLACVLVASLIAAGVHGQRIVLQEILIAVLMVTTSPVSTILLMQAGIYRKTMLASESPLAEPPQSARDSA
ncbi:multisubunit potassium/proton antiporter PhaG subunit [Paucimonas lemoignei]|uniref:Multisubunit potassium/proton antiporter PhaG subunit n=1 Tax=Paucimonas lemoignei TaxID=29443 RepID=A0A4R3HWA7_PAULE|nr:monovalent cation/H(+) antiporter subunit G [Paucimonas lemoignei]TCS36531.1 multisubunit potassium/proton antiporter PhaG subunit [Paucimonas lemoignei]